MNTFLFICHESLLFIKTQYFYLEHGEEDLFQEIAGRYLPDAVLENENVRMTTDQIETVLARSARNMRKNWYNRRSSVIMDPASQGYTGASGGKTE